MKAFASFLLAAGMVAAISPRASRISEPDTILYGRIVERTSNREFLVTSGQLSWKLRTTGAAPKEYNFTTRLEPIGNGVYSYRLTIPHQVLAYDLTINSKSIGLAAASIPVQHLSVELDGKPLTLNPAAVDGFTLDQTRRASAVRIDLALSSNTMDSDGDSLPDWWEDKSGFDKFDPSDGVNLTAAPASQASPASFQIRTFAEWRAVWFPNNDGDLEVFGQEDADQDGVPNFLEYAFDLDPTVADASASALPRIIEIAGRKGVTFQKRANATDLVYQIESSEDLFHWKDASSEIEESAPSTYFERPAASSSSQRFFRVRVNRQ
jgi:hypothetical protein